jgi:hypothetical protein
MLGLKLSHKLKHKVLNNKTFFVLIIFSVCS